MRFECFAGDIGYLYVAKVAKEGDRFVILSLDYVGNLPVEK